MLYVISFPDGWFKLGHTSDLWQRVCHFWTNKHPTDLCGKLGPEDVRVIALFAGGLVEEQQLFAEFAPQCGEFFHESSTSLHAILAAAAAKFEALPVPPRPDWGTCSVEKLPCCGGVEFTCFSCGAKFARSIKLKQHLDDMHRKVRSKCGCCGVEVIPRNLKRHAKVCKKG